MANTIFIYEDVEEYSNAYVQALEPEGWEIKATGTADEALHVLNNGTEFDLYVLDILENDEPRGLNLLRELRPRETRRKVIMLTQSDEIRYAAEASELGAWSFMLKQYHEDPTVAVQCTAERLVEKVREAEISLEERRACRLAEALWGRLTAPNVPSLSGLNVECLLRQKHRSFGGDFYWAKTNDRMDSLTVLLGDITDKGPAAAIIALLGLASLQIACGNPQGNEELLELLLQANKSWFQLTAGLEPTHEYQIAASAIQLRRRENHWIATAAGCGAPPIVIIRAKTGTEVIDSGCHWLGMQKVFKPESDQRVLDPGDVVVLVTDGLHPSGSPSLLGKMNKEEWLGSLERIVREMGNHLPDASGAILRELSVEPPEDDRSVILIRCEQE